MAEFYMKIFRKVNRDVIIKRALLLKNITKLNLVEQLFASLIQNQLDHRENVFDIFNVDFCRSYYIK